MVEIEKVIRSLSEANVEYVIVGVALKSHSSGYVTYDFDFCYQHSNEILNSIVKALAPHKPRREIFQMIYHTFSIKRLCETGPISPLKQILKILIC